MYIILQSFYIPAFSYILPPFHSIFLYLYYNA
uniref:Uncharacterized protein n=1 Tax=Siphoviridae sp. ct87j35 TaxID=2825356 RepID=A0A8S5V4N9_9CAUD|nr:MAG TPA: hypothetical protein [Siphoviridae sp. ct87j35]